MMLKVKLAMGALVLAALAPGAAIMYAPLAGADTNAQVFVEVLNRQGIFSHYGDADLVHSGYMICDRLAHGATEMAVVQELWLNSDLDAYNAGFMVGAAESAFCPGLAGSTGSLT